MSDQVPKALKIVVISMGVLILGGFLWVGAVIVSRAGETAEAASKPVNVAEDCRQVALPAPPNAKLEFEGGEWLVTGKYEVRRYTPCGELIQITTLTGDV